MATELGPETPKNATPRKALPTTVRIEVEGHEDYSEHDLDTEVPERPV